MSSVWDSDFKVPMRQEILVGIWSCQVSLAIGANEALKAGWFFFKKIISSSSYSSSALITVFCI